MRRLRLEQATVADLRTIATFMDDVCAGCIEEEAVLYKVKMAVDEACTNVFEHAYKGQKGRLELEAECTSRRLFVSIRDWGRSFDPTAVPVPDGSLPIEKRPIGGLGIYLIRKVMDTVEYRFEGEEGNCLTLEKALHS